MEPGPNNENEPTDTPPSSKPSRKGIRLQNWKQDDMAAAIQALTDATGVRPISTKEERIKILSNFKQVKTIANSHNVPRVTLRDRWVAGKHIGDHLLGKATALTSQEEGELSAIIIQRAECGWGITVDKLREIAYQYCKEKEKTSPENVTSRLNAKDNKAGMHWWYGFKSRHPEISNRQAENLSIQRVLGMSRARIYDYFEFLRHFLEDNNMKDKPHLTFNMDETGVQVVVPASKILAKRGSKNVVAITSKERGSNTTVVACCSAAGVFLPPLVVFKGARARESDRIGFPTSWSIMLSKSGYVDKDIIVVWLEHFIEHRPPVENDEWSIIFMDGHSTHDNNAALFQLASQNRIFLVLIPSHTSATMQPLDISVFKSFKASFKFQVRQFQANKPGMPLHERTPNYNQILSQAWLKATKPENAINGFRKSGLCPFDPRAIDESAFRPSDALLASGDDTSAPNDSVASDGSMG